MITIKRILLSFCLMPFLMDPASAASTPLTPKKEKQYQQVFLEEVNRYRLSKGLNKLALNEMISKEAKQHSRDMAEKKMKFGHEDFDKRIAHIKQTNIAFAGGAENIACFKLPPKTVVQKLLTSHGHKRNIAGKYNLTGIGIVQDKEGWIYYTQIFIKDKKKA